MKASFPLLGIAVNGRGVEVTTPAKLNLFLEVNARRPDGFHDITSLMIPIDFCDRIQVAPADAGAEDSLAIAGSAAAGVPLGPENLILRAVASVRAARSIPPVSVRLTKEIPAGSGLGGGSANAAGVLAALEALYPSGRSRARLMECAASLGSDVPFFLGAGAQVARGRGERLTPIRRELFGGERPWFLLLMPNVASSTALAYARLTFPLTLPNGPISFDVKTFAIGTQSKTNKMTWAGEAKSARGAVPRSGSAGTRWTDGLFNRLEHTVLASHSELMPLAAWLESSAPRRWRMTGSGSTFYVACTCAEEGESLAKRVGNEAGLRALSLRTRIARPLAVEHHTSGRG
ncbi:MAG: 4-(cytidine 5'-diphospho)-2-C-methyl-D-erythritol kinase [Planctomycetes bacterium]|nr:4-(cytidine 5'-diphospho)-2-C-methyl-D-erythritol kinase [Planctomycetota bacterium]